MDNNNPLAVQIVRRLKRLEDSAESLDLQIYNLQRDNDLLSDRVLDLEYQIGNLEQRFT